MRYRFLLSSVLLGTELLLHQKALAHSATVPDTGTQASAALSTTWRNDGVVLTNGRWQIPGLLMGGEAYPVEQAVTLDEARFNISHRNESGAFGLLQIASHDNNVDAELHHALLGYEFSDLPFDLSLEAGRMAAQFTPANASHAADRLFSESDLALDAFFGRQWNDAGLRMMATQWQLTLGLETWRGAAFPATRGDNNSAYDLFLHHRARFESFDWYSGLWFLSADATKREDQRYSVSAHNHGTSQAIVAPSFWFSGQTQAEGAFVNLNWALTKAQLLHLGAEWMRVEPEGVLADATRNSAMSSRYDSARLQLSLESGRHEVGLRWEQLTLDNTLAGPAAETLSALAGLNNDGFEPTRSTFIYRWQIDQTLALRTEWSLDKVNSKEQRLALGAIWKVPTWSR
ncbi:MAG TPA: hypothetical protein VFV48_08030 [Pseudomonadales bacterium]|nr:hypothetical protein [Pseudomonadales bacterium]